MLDITFHLNDYENSFELINKMAFESQDALYFPLGNDGINLRYSDTGETIQIFDRTSNKEFLKLSGQLNSVSNAENEAGNKIVNLRFIANITDADLKILQPHTTITIKES